MSYTDKPLCHTVKSLFLVILTNKRNRSKLTSVEVYSVLEKRIIKSNGIIHCDFLTIKKVFNRLKFFIVCNSLFFKTLHQYRPQVMLEKVKLSRVTMTNTDNEPWSVLLYRVRK